MDNKRRTQRTTISKALWLVSRERCSGDVPLDRDLLGWCGRARQQRGNHRPEQSHRWELTGLQIFFWQRATTFDVSQRYVVILHDMYNVLYKCCRGPNDTTFWKVGMKMIVLLKNMTVGMQSGPLHHAKPFTPLTPWCCPPVIFNQYFA